MNIKAIILITLSGLIFSIWFKKEKSITVKELAVMLLFAFIGCVVLGSAACEYLGFSNYNNPNQCFSVKVILSTVSERVFSIIVNALDYIKENPKSLLPKFLRNGNGIKKNEENEENS